LIQENKLQPGCGVHVCNPSAPEAGAEVSRVLHLSELQREPLSQKPQNNKNKARQKQKQNHKKIRYKNKTNKPQNSKKIRYKNKEPPRK
jgi:hypothetical protein